MKKNKVVVLLCVLILAALACADSVDSGDPTPALAGESDLVSPDWVQIKAAASLHVALPDEFGQPYIQAHNTLAWEDGVFISRDGLHMYAFFSPADVISYAQYFFENPICPDIAPYLRGPQLGMDLVTNPWGCESFLQSEIAYTSRPSTDEDFAPWQISGLSQVASYEGGFQAMENPNGTIDFVFTSSTENNNADLFWGRGTQHNPTLEGVTALPAPINSPGQEDNPHLERLSEDTLVLLFDNHGLDDSINTTIKYSLSADNGATWSEPQLLGGEINAGPHDMHGHLFFDGSDWWLYFASARDGSLSIYRSKHNNSPGIATDFDNWGAVELVLAPGQIDGDLGSILAVGEPTLTLEGDLSFVTVYQSNEQNPFDRFEIDPWYLPSK